MRTRSERGTATFVMLGVLAVVLAVAAAGMVVGGYLVAVHRARAAADLAALSGAAAFQHGGAACPKARAIALSNGADLVVCDQVGDQLDFVVTARVRVRIGSEWALPGLPKSVEAIAYAGTESSWMMPGEQVSLWFHRSSAHGTAEVSGSSREGSEPFAKPTRFGGRARDQLVVRWLQLDCCFRLIASGLLASCLLASGCRRPACLRPAVGVRLLASGRLPRSTPSHRVGSVGWAGITAVPASRSMPSGAGPAAGGRATIELLPLALLAEVAQPGLEDLQEAHRGGSSRVASSTSASRASRSAEVVEGRSVEAGAEDVLEDGVEAGPEAAVADDPEGGADDGPDDELDGDRVTGRRGVGPGAGGRSRSSRGSRAAVSAFAAFLRS